MMFDRSMITKVVTKMAKRKANKGSGRLCWVKSSNGIRSAHVVEAVRGSAHTNRILVKYLTTTSGDEEEWVMGNQVTYAAPKKPTNAGSELDLFYPSLPAEEHDENKTKTKVFVRSHETQAWFRSPLPHHGDAGELHCCDGCLQIFGTRGQLHLHNAVCELKFAPLGDEVYFDSSRRISLRELDGRSASCVDFCQRVSLLTKLFLDHKMTLADVHYFSFFCLFEVDDSGAYHFAGYFSKEWDVNCNCENNLACIMVLPPYQTKGYGYFLMQASYELSKLEHRLGTPERPLSDLGRRAYISLWCDMVLDMIIDLNDVGLPISVASIAESTSMVPEDVFFTMHYLGILKMQTASLVTIVVPTELLERHRARKLRRKVPFMQKLLSWTPLVRPS